MNLNSFAINMIFETTASIESRRLVSSQWFNSLFNCGKPIQKFHLNNYLGNIDENNEENIEIDENPSLPDQTDEIDQPVEQSDTSPITPVQNQDEPDFTQGEINQDSSNSSNTTEQTNTSTKTTTTSTTTSTILSTSTEGRDINHIIYAPL